MFGLSVRIAVKIPTITGLIRRRILLNFRLAPEAAHALLPAVFRPKLVRGYAIAGTCLIRLEEIRALGFPKALGWASENSAHRFAVELEGLDGGRREGALFRVAISIPARTPWRVAGFSRGAHHFSRFPPGGIGFDHALLMRDIPYCWQSVPGMSSGAAQVPGSSALSRSHSA